MITRPNPIAATLLELASSLEQRATSTSTETAITDEDATAAAVLTNGTGRYGVDVLMSLLARERARLLRDLAAELRTTAKAIPGMVVPL